MYREAYLNEKNFYKWAEHEVAATSLSWKRLSMAWKPSGSLAKKMFQTYSQTDSFLGHERTHHS